MFNGGGGAAVQSQVRCLFVADIAQRQDGLSLQIGGKVAPVLKTQTQGSQMSRGWAEDGRRGR